MNQLEKTLTSIEVAEMVNKDHSNLLKDIRRYTEQLAEVNLHSGDFFQESTYQDANNQARPCYLVTKKGCEFIAHKLTGTKGTEFTAKYINKFHDMEQIINKPLTLEEMMRVQLSMVDNVSDRVDKLENTMNIDYGQQQMLKKLVNASVVKALGGIGSPAYKETKGKTFSECNRDIQDYFKVNSRNNIPRVKYEEACNYISKWQPCTNTKMLIDDHNNQLSLA